MDIDITKPFKSGVFLPRIGLKDLWIGLKYEKLLDICYKCGILGHKSRFYVLPPYTLSNEFRVRFIALGPWLQTNSDLSPLDIYAKLPQGRIHDPSDRTTESETSTGKKVDKGTDTPIPPCPIDAIPSKAPCMSGDNNPLVCGASQQTILVPLQLRTYDSLDPPGAVSVLSKEPPIATSSNIPS